jgi:hypothetical protein
MSSGSAAVDGRARTAVTINAKLQVKLFKAYCCMGTS